MLVSLSDMKTYLGIPSTDTTYDSFLTSQLTLVSEVVETYCRRSFEQRTFTETFYKDDFDRTKTLSLFHYPIISITSVEEDGVELDTDYYRLHKGTGLITRTDDYYFFSGEEVEVVYSTGYATYPTPIIDVVQSIVQERYNKKTSGVDLNFGSDVQRVSIPGTISIDFDYSLSNNERSTPFGVILGSYVNVLDYYRSDRAVVGRGTITYLE